MEKEKPKIFISHSWEDNEISQKLAECFIRDGLEVWIDTTRISGGDSLPEVIGQGIEWCDVFILIWSRAAKDSRYVRMEWNCAFNLDKRIIPCVIEDEKLPAILSHLLHINFANFEQGYNQLARDIDPTIKEASPKILTTTEPEVVITAIQEKKRKRAIPLLKKMIRKKILWILFTILCILIAGYAALHSGLSSNQVRAMLKEHDFFDSYWNKTGNGFVNHYEAQAIKNDKIVTDKASRLMWQQAGSLESMTCDGAKEWINKTNKNYYAGFNDWQLPTLEQAMTLMESETKATHLFIDLNFDTTQTYIWTGNLARGWLRAWIVEFNSGKCSNVPLYYYAFVRAVRSVQPSQE